MRHYSIYLPCLRPLLPLALALACGQWLGSYRVGIWLVIPVTFILVLICRYLLNFRLHCLAWLVPACLLLAGLLQLQRHVPARQQAQQLQGRETLLTGKVVSLPHPDYQSSTVLVRQPGGITVALTGPGKQLTYGRKIQAQVTWSTPDPARNPGGFSQADWLWRQGVYLQATPAAANEIREIRPPPSFSLKQLAADQRGRLVSFLGRFLSPVQTGRLAAIMLGEKSLLPAADQMALRRAGLSHLAAVSGTHVTLLLMPVQELLKRRRLGRRRRIVLLLLVLLGYGFLTGWPLSLSRAVLMNSSVLIGRLLKRGTDALQGLSLAAFILLLRPHTALSIGFWLSLSATAVLIIAARPLAERISQRFSWMPESASMLLAVPLCAQATVMPLAVSLSGELTYIGLLSNIAAIWLVQAVLLLALILLPVLGVLSLLLPGSATILPVLALPLETLLAWLFRLADFFAGLPLPRILAGQLNLLFWLLILLIFTAASGLWRRAATFFTFSPLQARRCYRQSLRLIACSLLISSLVSGLMKPPVRVWFFDVGQGDAILIQTRHGRTILIDGGRSGCGYRVLAPALNALAISRIDLAIATHGHDDHLGGLVELMEMKRVRQIMLPAGLIRPCPQSLPDQPNWQVVPTAEASTDRLVERALQVAGQRSIRVQTLQRHDTISLNRSAGLAVLYPGPRPPDAPLIQDGNDLSLQILAGLYGHHLLLTGDATARIESLLLSQQDWPETDLLKVAHHGSGQTTSAAFLERVQAKAAVISVGRANRYGHPADVVLENLKDAGVRIWRTDENGAIRWQAAASGWHLAVSLP